MLNKRTVLAATLAATVAISASVAFASDRSETRREASNAIASRTSAALVASFAAPVSFGDKFLDFVRALRGVTRVGPPVRDNGAHTEGIADGPDGWDPLGVKGKGTPADGPAPANSRVP
jgi:hypothetical protein